MNRRNDPGDWMWAQACDFLERAERMHRQFFRLTDAGERTVWEPPADIFESDREVVAIVALPGVVADGVEVTHDSGGLVVRAQRPQPLLGAGYELHQLEIPYGYFERRIALPTGPLELASSELTHGCLILRLRKA